MKNKIAFVAVGQAGGNMEGKESRFGIASSSTWSAFTTAASNGSVNSMHDSYTPLGGFVQMLQIALGEVVFGGVGCGLYGMIGFAILTVFIAGLMVGRTPEFLGKKIEPGEMRWAVVLCLATPFAILVCSAIACMVPGLADQLNNGGAHGFSEALYAFTGVCRHELQHSLDQRHARPRDAVRPLHAHHRYAGYRRLAGQEE